ncbi:MAG: DUF1311 domain-containing protein [Gammaproteobacteria bacterium]|nr:DUF1311 domain-containing protein [Gammaproteobacteria bacterium]MDH5653388.1 DUF1311 domain-containing protein [Gammaproteobacteria bacterium]
MRWCISILCVYFIASAALSAAEITQADLNKLRAAAEQGNAAAQLDYAKAISEKDYQAAHVWAQKAADQNLAEAWFWLGHNSIGDTLRYYVKAAELGHEDALRYALDGALFRANNKTDLVLAKRLADLARKNRVDLGYGTESMLLTVDRCVEAGKLQPPAADLPSAEEKTRLSKQEGNCDAYQHGIDVAQDYTKYRKCLLSESYVDNAGLAEIYANGWGVKRQPLLALSLVCHGSGVPAELEGMVETLYTTREEPVLHKPFLFCDHVTSGMNGGICSARAEAVRQAERRKEIGALQAGWTEQQRKLFMSAFEKADIFWDTHSSEEQDMSGTARASIAIAEHAELKEAFLTAIRGFEAGRFPAAGNFKQVDAELNTIYRQIMAKEKPEQYGTVTKQGIRDTQRKWLRYRDAFVKFALQRYPGKTADYWRNWLTVNRNAQLKVFLED